MTANATTTGNTTATPDTTKSRHVTVPRATVRVVVGILVLMIVLWGLVIAWQRQQMGNLNARVNQLEDQTRNLTNVKDQAAVRTGTCLAIFDLRTPEANAVAKQLGC
jgi:uncharacterized protein HemX